MKQWFFFNRINMFGDNPAIDQTKEHTGTIFTHTAQAAFAAGYPAMMLTKMTRNRLTWQFFIKKRLFHAQPPSILEL